MLLLVLSQTLINWSLFLNYFSFFAKIRLRAYIISLPLFIWLQPRCVPMSYLLNQINNSYGILLTFDNTAERKLVDTTKVEEFLFFIISLTSILASAFHGGHLDLQQCVLYVNGFESLNALAWHTSKGISRTEQPIISLSMSFERLLHLCTEKKTILKINHSFSQFI